MKKKYKHLKLKVNKKFMEQVDKNYERAALFGQKQTTVSTADRRQTSRRAPSNILQTAESLIYGVRNKTYRHPSENFENIANLWNAYFEAIKVRPDVLTINKFSDSIQDRHFKINRIDVAYLNILQKIARGATNQEHEDTVVDIAGYAGCIERILKNV